MEEHPIQTSTSTKRAHFMDEWTDRRLLRHGEMALEYLWVGSPCQRPVRRLLRHGEMALEYLWAGVPCQRSAGYRQETGLTPVPDSLATHRCP